LMQETIPWRGSMMLRDTWKEGLGCTW